MKSMFVPRILEMLRIHTHRASALTLVLAYIVALGNAWGGGGVTNSQASVSYPFTSIDADVEAFCRLCIRKLRCHFIVDINKFTCAFRGEKTGGQRAAFISAAELG